MKEIKYDEINFNPKFCFGNGWVGYFYGNGYAFEVEASGPDLFSHNSYYQLDSLSELEDAYNRWCDSKYHVSNEEEKKKYNEAYNEMKERLINENINKFNVLIEKINLLEEKIIDIDDGVFKLENYNVYDSNNSIGLKQINSKINYYKTILEAKKLSDDFENDSLYIRFINDYDFNISSIYLKYLELLKEFKESVDFLKKYCPDFDFSSYTDRFKKDESYQKVK